MEEMLTIIIIIMVVMDMVDLILQITVYLVQAEVDTLVVELLGVNLVLEVQVI